MSTGGSYELEELRKIANTDGGPEISKTTFVSTHSRLAKQYWVSVGKGLRGKPATYKKVDR